MLKDHISSQAFFLFVNSSGSKALLSEKPSFAFVCFSLFNLAKSQQLGGELPCPVPSPLGGEQREPCEALTAGPADQELPGSHVTGKNELWIRFNWIKAGLKVPAQPAACSPRSRSKEHPGIKSAPD